VVTGLPPDNMPRKPTDSRRKSALSRWDWFFTRYGKTDHARLIG